MPFLEDRSEAEPIFLLTDGKTNKAAVVTLLPVIMSGYKASASKACHNFEIPHAIEISRSGNGAHLWIFFNEKVPAKEARLLGFGLLDKAMEFYPNLSFDSYDRLFPNQDILPEDGFGNLIARPLQKEARLSGNSSLARRPKRRAGQRLNMREDGTRCRRGL